MPILCSMEPQVAPLASPGLLSASGRNLGTRNREMPLEPAGASGSLASTRWIWLPVRSCSPPVMKILVPVMLKEPSSLGTALVRRMPRSVPECGSVRHMVPLHSPLYSLGRYWDLSSSEAWASTARQAPLVSAGYRANEEQALCIISSNSTASDLGIPWPPNSGLPENALQPFSANVLNASLKPSGVVTSPSFQVQPCSSLLRFSGNSSPSVILPASSRMASDKS